MASVNFVKLVSGPTHNRGHTLDLGFTAGLTVPSLALKETGISDHLCVMFSFKVESAPNLQVPAA